jgi:Na+/melibiose symporter-like transporter
MFFFITLYLQQVLGYSPLETGLAYLPMALTIIVVAGIASQLVTQLGVKPVLMLGMALTSLALMWFSQVPVDGGFAIDVLGPSILAGAGLGLAIVPDTVAAMMGVRPEESGLASG